MISVAAHGLAQPLLLYDLCILGALWFVTTPAETTKPSTQKRIRGVSRPNRTRLTQLYLGGDQFLYNKMPEKMHATQPPQPTVSSLLLLSISSL